MGLAASFPERAHAEIKRGVLQVAVLSLLRQPTYGYDLLKRLDACDLPTEEGTLYPVLRRLQGEGLLTSEWDTSGSRPRKYYRTTDEGVAVMQQLAAEWSRVHAALEAVLGEADGNDDDSEHG